MTIAIIKDILIIIKHKLKDNKKITNYELDLLKKYISKSTLFNGNKKKLYSQIKKYRK